MPGQIDRDRVAGDPSLRSGEQPLLADQPVDQRRLAGIGPPDHGDVDGPGLILRGGRRAGPGVVRQRGLIRQGATERRVEIGKPLAMLGGQRDRLAEAEREGFERTGGGGAALALVGDHDGRLAGLAHQLGKRTVARGEAAARIDHEEHRIGRLDRGPGLRHHAPRQAAGRRLLEPGGVHHHEVEIAEPGLALAAVARHSGPVVDQGEPLADQPVEQGGLADIRPSDDRHRESHGRGSTAR